MSSTHLEPDGDALLSYTIDVRLHILINEVTRGKADWKGLSDKTGVSAEKWRNFNRGATKASTEMIEAICMEWPQYAFWLTTGVSDENGGHHAPMPYLGFPRLGRSLTEAATEDATEYYRDCANAIQKIWSRALTAMHKSSGEPVTWELVASAIYQGFTLNAESTAPPLPQGIIAQIATIQRKKEIALRTLDNEETSLDVAEMPRIKWADLKSRKGK